MCGRLVVFRKSRRASEREREKRDRDSDRQTYIGGGERKKKDT